MSNDLVQRLRHYEFVPFDLHDEAANTIESQSAELTRLRERNAELEKERDHWKEEAHDISDDGKWTLWWEIADDKHKAAAPLRARIASFEATVMGLREELEWYGENARLCRLIHSEGDKGRSALSDDGGNRARAALASSESVVVKSEGEKDGVE